MSIRVYSRLAMSAIDEDYYSSLLDGKDKDEEEFNLPSEAIKVYRDKQRMKREWSDELENWKRLGIEARRDQRRHTRNEQLALKAKRLAIKYIWAHNVGDAGDAIPKSQLERASAFFQRAGIFQKVVQPCWVNSLCDAFQINTDNSRQRFTTSRG